MSAEAWVWIIWGVVALPVAIGVTAYAMVDDAEHGRDDGPPGVLAGVAAGALWPFAAAAALVAVPFLLVHATAQLLVRKQVRRARLPHDIERAEREAGLR